MWSVAGKKGEISFITCDEYELEILARLEHLWWMREKRVNGLTFGKRSDTKKIHPDHGGWDELSEEEKGKGRDFARAIPQRLAGVELRFTGMMRKTL